MCHQKSINFPINICFIKKHSQRFVADVDAVSVRDSLQTPIVCFWLECQKKQYIVVDPKVMAAARGHTSVAELLVANGADLFHFDANGHSALQLAQMNGHYSCAHQLILAIEQLHKDAARKYQVSFFEMEKNGGENVPWKLFHQAIVCCLHWWWHVHGVGHTLGFGLPNHA